MKQKQVIQCLVCNDTHEILMDEDQRRGVKPFSLLCPNVTRLYRLTSMIFDARRNHFESEHLKDSQENIKKRLKHELGEFNFDQKFERWLKIKHTPITFYEEYLKKLPEIINTYASGYYYPAITSAGCLGERILNDLLLKTKEYFKASPHYKKVFRKESCDKWDELIEILFDWNILSNRAKIAFMNLKKYRNDSVHYNKDYDFEGNTPVAINLLIEAINSLFDVKERSDLFWIFNIPGEIWIKSDAINNPFVQEFVIPKCYLAHAKHEIDEVNMKIIEKNPVIGVLSDEEFIKIRKEYKANS